MSKLIFKIKLALTKKQYCSDISKGDDFSCINTFKVVNGKMYIIDIEVF